MLRMNSHLYKLGALVFILVAGTIDIPAPVYSSNVVGYVNFQFNTGSNLFVNPLKIYDNTLTNLFPLQDPQPEGITVSLWNPNNTSFDTTAIYTNGSWSTNLTLPPGTGALLITPSPFNKTFLGTLLDHNGNPLGGQNLNYPSVFTNPPGIYLLGDKMGMLLNTDTNIFLNILGRMPYVGEKVTSLTNSCTYLGNGNWDSISTLDVSQAAFFTILPEPSPSLAIALINNQSILSWPATVSVWTLQTNDNLATGTWGDFAGTVSNNIATNPLTAGNLFFRLAHP